jgi:hypothetical protein
MRGYKNKAVMLFYPLTPALSRVGEGVIIGRMADRSGFSRWSIHHQDFSVGQRRKLPLLHFGQGGMRAV